jgi:hypothetical protein
MARGAMAARNPVKVTVVGSNPTGPVKIRQGDGEAT